MADTIRTTAALQTILADNTGGDISPQDLRDMLVSSFNRADDAVAILNTSNTGTFQVSSTCTASSFVGSGASLTSLPAAQLTGTLPALAAGSLTGLNATQLTTGTIPDGRQGSNVVLRNATANTFQNSSTGTTTLSLKGNGSNGSSLYIQNSGSNGIVIATDNSGNITYSSNRGVTTSFGADGGNYQIGGSGRDSEGASINLYAGNASAGAVTGGSINLTAGGSSEGTGGSIILTPGTGDIEPGQIVLNGGITVSGTLAVSDTISVAGAATLGSTTASVLNSNGDCNVAANLTITGQLRPAFDNTTLDVSSNIKAIAIYDGDGQLQGYIGVFSAV